MEGIQNTTMDDEVYWGPITVKEIKKILSIKKTPEIRRTLETANPSRKINFDFPTVDNLIKEQFFKTAADELQRSCISETFDKQEVENLTERVTKAIDFYKLDTSTMILSEDFTGIIKSLDNEKESELKSDNNVKASFTSLNQINTEFKCDDKNIDQKKSINENLDFVKLNCMHEYSKNVAANEMDVEATFIGDQDDKKVEETRNQNYKFNDTLDEIEMVLSNGLDYTMSGSPVIERELLVQKVLVESTKCQPKSVPKSRMNKPSKFEHVYSPVALYIKNSPRVPQVKHVFNTPMKNKILTTKVNVYKENFDEINLPKKVYTPSKRTIMKPSECKMMPKSLQHTISTPHIIRHQGRIDPKQLNEQVVEKKLLENDLTVGSFDEGVLETSKQGDFSVICIKKAFIN